MTMIIASSSHPIEFIVEATRVADWVTIVIPSPQNCLGGLTVAALIVHTLQIRFLEKRKYRVTY